MWNKSYLLKIGGTKKQQCHSECVSRPITTTTEKRSFFFRIEFAFHLGDKPFKNYRKSKYLVPSKNFPVSMTRNFADFHVLLAQINGLGV